MQRAPLFSGHLLVELMSRQLSALAQLWLGVTRGQGSIIVRELQQERNTRGARIISIIYKYVEVQFIVYRGEVWRFVENYFAALLSSF